MAADRPRVVVAMSGGVDSSVAAHLLCESHQVVGITMKIWPAADRATPGARSCCSIDAVTRARRVADRLGIPFYALDMEADFDSLVIRDFVAEYSAGRTPNPCVRCNAHLKFGRLLDRARALGASRLATGHYVRVVQGPDGEPWLMRSSDASKDQSYALWMLTRDQLAAALFPLGELTKPRVREIARDLGLPTAETPESQDICFVSDGDYRSFLAGRSTPPGPGDFVDLEGRVLGRHGGYTHFTIGQRRGLGLAIGHPTYVVAIDPAANRVVVGSSADLERDAFEVSHTNWLIDEPATPVACTVKIRYNGAPVAATVTALSGRATVRASAAPFRAVTPGQSAVFYGADGRVLGGGLCT